MSVELIIAMTAVLVAQIVKGTTGFGAGLVCIPILSVLWSPAEAIFLASVTDAVAGFFLWLEVRREVRWRLVLAVLAAMAPGLFLGLWLLEVLPRQAILVTMGAVVAAMGMQFALWPVQVGRGELEEVPDDPRCWRQALGAGAIAGVAAGAIGTPGPPIIYWARLWFTDHFFRAQVVAMFLIVAATLPVSLLSKGLTDLESSWKLFFLMPVVPVGASIGAWLSPRLSRVAFGRMVGVILTGAGLTLLMRAGQAWIG